MRMSRRDLSAENPHLLRSTHTLEAMEKLQDIGRGTLCSPTQESQEYRDLKAQESLKSLNQTQDQEAKRPKSPSQMRESSSRTSSTTLCKTTLKTKI